MNWKINGSLLPHQTHTVSGYVMHDTSYIFPGEPY